MKCKTIALLIVFATLFPQKAAAITAKEFTEKFSKEYQTGYLLGLINMYSYQFVLSGNKKRARCLFYEGTKNASIDLIFKAFKRWPDKPPSGLVVVIMNKACPK